MHYLLLAKFHTLSNVFSAFDRNDDDFIDESELKKGFLIFCNYKTEENIKLFLDYFDKVEFFFNDVFNGFFPRIMMAKYLLPNGKALLFTFLKM